MKNILGLLFVVMVLISSCKKDEVDDTDDNNNQTTLNLVTNVTNPTTLTSDKVWTVDGYISVNSDLTIEAGTKIEFKEGASLHIGEGTYGSLIALGTSDNPITFTSSSIVPSKGDWVGVIFHDYNSSSTTEMTYCKFYYGGHGITYANEGGVIELYSTSVKMSNCTIEKSLGSGIYLDINSEFSTFVSNSISDCNYNVIITSAKGAGSIGANNTFSSSASYGILIYQSDIATNITWSKQNSDYFISDWITVSGTSAILEIKEGTTLKFSPSGTIRVGGEGGKLVASGSATEPILFTSAASSPAAGDWNFIDFQPNTTNGTIIDNCIIEYSAGWSDDNEDASIYIGSSNVSITNSTVRFSEGYGIYVYNGYTPIITNITYSDNNNLDIFYEE